MDHQRTKGRFSAIFSASDTNLNKDRTRDIASRLSDSGSRPEQFSVEQKPQQAPPPTTSRRRRFLNKLRLGEKSQSSSPLPSPLPCPSPRVEPPKVTSDHHIVAPASFSGHNSPSSSDVQGCVPIIQVSPSPSEPTASESPEPPSTCTPNNPIPIDQVQSQAETNTHAAELRTDSDDIKPPPHSSMVWVEALEIVSKKLCENNLPPLDLTILTSQSAEENIQTVFKSLNTLQEDEQKRRWRYTWRGKEVIIVERLGEILRSVEKYSGIVGTAIQSNPQVGALVWAGIQGIMQVTLNHVEVIEGFEVAIAALLEKMAMCEFYSRIYSGVTLPSQSTVNSSQLQSMVDSALPDLYAAVIVFSVKARTYYEAKGMKKLTNVLKSFDIEFQPFIDEINTKEEAIRQCADAATMQRVSSKYSFP